MPDQNEKEQAVRRARIMEIAISVMASIVTSAVVVSWTLSGTLSRLNERVESHERRVSIVESATAVQAPVMAAISARQNASEISDREKTDRLIRIEDKVSLLLERNGR